MKIPQKWLTQDMEVHLPSSCAAASSDLTVCGFYSLILLLIPLLLIRSRWQFNSLTRPMAGNCWPDSAWSIIVHLLIHIHLSLSLSLLTISLPPPLPFQLIELSCLGFLPLPFLALAKSWLGFITFMQFIDCALSASASCCPGPHTPASQPASPLCPTHRAQGGPGYGKIQQN